MLSEDVAKLHISIVHLHELSPNRLCIYNLKKRVQVFGNNTSMAKFKIAVTPLLTHWSYRSLALTRRHVHGNVRNYKTGHCHAECNVPALWPPSYFKDLSHNRLVICFPSCNLLFCGLIGNISVTFVENGLLITPIYFVTKHKYKRTHIQYSDVRRPLCRLESPVNRLFVQHLVQTNNTETSRVRITAPL